MMSRCQIRSLNWLKALYTESNKHTLFKGPFQRVSLFYFQGGDHHPAVPQQQHIELGGFPAMSEATSKTDLDRQDSLPPQYDDMLPVAAAAANDGANTTGDTEDLVPETGEKYQRFQ